MKRGPHLFVLDDDWTGRRMRGGEIHFENFLRDDASVVEGVVKREVVREGMVRDGGDDAVFEEIVGLKTEDADGFDADVVISGSVDDGGIGLIGNGAREDVGGAAAGMRDADQRDFDLFEGAVEVEVEAGELAHAEFAVDLHAGANFFAAGAVGFEADAGF